MGHPASIRKTFVLLSLAVVLSLLVTTTVYACSGLRLLQMTTPHSSMDSEDIKRGPCADHKQDICKSVRARMLSIQPGLIKAPDGGPLSYFPTLQVVESFKDVVFLPHLFDLKIVYHPVFKLSLPFSFLVLRI